MFALAWAAMRRDVPEIAVAGVIGSVPATPPPTLGRAARVQPLRVSGILVPAIAAAVMPVALVEVTPGGRLNPKVGAVLVAGYRARVAAILAC